MHPDEIDLSCARWFRGVNTWIKDSLRRIAAENPNGWTPRASRYWRYASTRSVPIRTLIATQDSVSGYGIRWVANGRPPEGGELPIAIYLRTGVGFVWDGHHRLVWDRANDEEVAEMLVLRVADIPRTERVAA